MKGGRYDAIVIAAGTTPLTAAYLARAKKSVLVLEAATLGAPPSPKRSSGLQVHDVLLRRVVAAPEIISRMLDLRARAAIRRRAPSRRWRNGDYLAAWVITTRRGAAVRHSPHDARRTTSTAAYAFMAQASSRSSVWCRPIRRRSRRAISRACSSWASISAARRERLHALVQAHDDELGGLSGRVVRDGRAQGDQVGKRIIGTFLGPRSPGTAYVLLHHYMGELTRV